jgi:hypothetical protein
MEIEAGREVERMLKDEENDRRCIAHMELQQAKHDVSPAGRRHATQRATLTIG